MVDVELGFFGACARVPKQVLRIGPEGEPGIIGEISRMHDFICGILVRRMAQRGRGSVL